MELVVGDDCARWENYVVHETLFLPRFLWGKQRVIKMADHFGGVIFRKESSSGVVNFALGVNFDSVVNQKPAPICHYWRTTATDIKVFEVIFGFKDDEVINLF